MMLTLMFSLDCQTSCRNLDLAMVDWLVPINQFFDLIEAVGVAEVDAVDIVVDMGIICIVIFEVYEY